MGILDWLIIRIIAWWFPQYLTHFIFWKHRRYFKKLSKTIERTALAFQAASENIRLYHEEWLRLEGREWREMP